MSWRKMKQSLWEREVGLILGRIDSVLVYAPGDEDRNALILAGSVLRDRLDAHNQEKEDNGEPRN